HAPNRRSPCTAGDPAARRWLRCAVRDAFNVGAVAQMKLGDSSVGDGGMAPAAPLHGVRVLSVGHTLPGIYCTAMLRALGAELVLVERVAGPGSDRYAALAGVFPTESLRAGISRLAIDLKNDRGRDLFLRLAADSDVVLESFKPGTAARLGIGF